jgi:hypothetical protein
MSAQPLLHALLPRYYRYTLLEWGDWIAQAIGSYEDDGGESFLVQLRLELGRN